ncbi:MAG: hypothetical protein H6592_15230 [Flavobacteriales bacterium]|nr:hypothetical protein [Flavobacteriales bacterium]
MANHPASRGRALLPLLLFAPALQAQQGGGIHGNFSTDAQYYNVDSAIGAVVPDQRLAANSWVNLIYTNGPFEAGARFENYTPALAGYPAGMAYSGGGIGYRYAKYKQDDLEVTVGNFFEQFGQGMIFRSYEERYLGVDNAMDGVRLKYRPVRGLYLKGVIGQQRLSFVNQAVKGPGIVRGIDAELSLSELLDTSWTSANNLIIGAGFVSKFQEDRDPQLELPQNVGAWAFRLNYTTPRWNLYTEYAYKINDPNNKNGFIYKEGQGLLVNATYSVRGFGLSMGAHSFDNMFFQSDRAAATPFDLNINFLPPLAKQHTYNLPATLYPYATQPNGEVAAQGELFYKWKKGTKLGGKYGTKLALNYSVAYALDTTRLGAADDTTARVGYRTEFFSPGKRRYFQDMNIELRKKVSENWEFALTYLNIWYDIDIIQGKPGQPAVHADIFVLEGLHNFTDRNSVRFEVQHLSTKQDHGNWATALAEFTFSPHWFVAAMDQFNYIGDAKLESKGLEQLHYPIGSVGYIRHGNRFQVNYGRQRAGIFCVGGVCRQVPAANGLTLSITSTF